MNAKPHPYFDGGLMMVKRNGTFSFFSSRNNNFSIRNKIGVLCVSGIVNGTYRNCTVDPSNGVLQGINPFVTGTSTKTVDTRQTSSSSVCVILFAIWFWLRKTFSYCLSKDLFS